MASDGAGGRGMSDEEVATPRPRRWLLGGLAAVALLGGMLAGSSVLRMDDADASDETARPPVALDARVGATFDCPDGERVGQLRSGDRVFVVGRDASGDWAAIRDPRRISAVVWVHDASLQHDTSAEVDLLECNDAVPLGAPSDPTTTTVPVDTTTQGGVALPTAPTATVLPRPGTTAPPTGPVTTAPTATTTAPDAQLPTVQASSSEEEVFRSSPPGCISTSTFSAVASDDIGVTSVTASWTGLPGGALAFTRVAGTATNGTWTATFGPFDHGSTVPNALVTVTARDAVGNARSTSFTITYRNVCLP
jgi:hypothetical protein